MAICSPKLFGYNLECTRRVGYGGLYAEMVHNNKLLGDAKGFYPVAFNGLQGYGQCGKKSTGCAAPALQRAGFSYKMVGRT